MRTDKGWYELQEEKAAKQLTWGKIFSEITIALVVVVLGFAICFALLLY